MNGNIEKVYKQVQWFKIRTTLHMDQGSWPRNSHGPWNSSKGLCTKFIHRLINFNGHKPLSLMWSEIEPCWETTTYFIEIPKWSSLHLLNYSHIFYISMVTKALNTCNPIPTKGCNSNHTKYVKWLLNIENPMHLLIFEYIGKTIARVKPEYNHQGPNPTRETKILSMHTNM